ncbi:hypothetical protein CASFOL_020235 [Castilleja foliolosa]|uniref:Uncharacterized protein n=1 Tax=Castilleja foliolosa TaxID=1961234 RepID=A0ABD3D120_9LAMI
MLQEAVDGEYSGGDGNFLGIKEEIGQEPVLTEATSGADADDLTGDDFYAV